MPSLARARRAARSPVVLAAGLLLLASLATCSGEEAQQTAGGGDAAAPADGGAAGEDGGARLDAGPTTGDGGGGEGGDGGEADAGGGGDGGGGASDAGLPAGDLVISSGDGHFLAVQYAPFALTLYRGAAVVARSAAPFLVLGVVPQIDESICYNPHLDEQGRGALPPGLRWVADGGAARLLPGEGTPEQPVLALQLEDGGQALLRLHAAAAGRFELQAGPLQPARGEVAFTRMRFDSPRTEAYYGLGEHFAQVQRRGTVQAMQFEVTELESVNNEAHVPIPFFTGNRGWGLFVEERRPGTFDMACLDQSAVSATFAADRLRAHLLADADPLQVVAAYTLLTGAPALPAIWAFAPMQWRNEHRDAAQVLEDARAMRQHRIPGSTIWIDNPWQTAYNTHLFDPERFPDPAGMIRELHGLGYRVVVWSTPYLQEEAGDAYQEAVEQGYFVDYTAFFTKFGKLVDLTNPGAVDLWKRLIGRVTSLGVEGFKLDYGEDVQIGTGQLRLRHLFHNGEDERTMHHGYQLFYHRPYAESLPAEGGFVLSRSGTYGDQALSTTIWPGDLDNDFRRYGEERHVGGLPSAIIGGLTLSASGFPLYASDIGGFRHGRPTAEVLLRWAAYASLLPIMQLGGGGTNHNPWDFAAHGDEPRYDEETLRVYRRFAQLHMELFPYAYTLAEQARRTGMPVTRPFGLVYPQDGRHPDFVFLVGEDLLAAPSPDGRAEVEVPLPQGRWLDWFSGEVASGRGSVVRAVPLDEVPLYLAEGGIVPLLRPGVDTLAPAVVAGVDSWAARPGPLGARLFPGPRPRERTVFDGARIAAHRDEAAGEVAIGLVAGQRFSGWQLAVEWRAAWGTEQPPARVLRDGSPLARAGSAQEAGECASCWFHEVASGRVRITATAGDHRLVLSR